MTTIYLDACCLNRPFDDLSQDRVRLESEAILIILSHVVSGEWDWITSDALMFEISRNPDETRRRRVAAMMGIAKRQVVAREKERVRTAQLVSLGFHAFDALHIACAESGGAGILLTTDDQMAERAELLARQLTVRVANPLVWLGEVTRK